MEYNPPPWLKVYLDRLDDIQDELIRTKQELLDTVYQMALEERKRIQQETRKQMVQSSPIPTPSQRRILQRKKPIQRIQRINHQDDGYNVDIEEF